jgi:ribosome maturation factor RimP
MVYNGIVLKFNFFANKRGFPIFAAEKRINRRERSRSLLLLTMVQDTQIKEIETIVNGLLEGDVFLVNIRVKPTNNFKVFLDADSGLGIEKCIKINRALYKIMEEKAMYPDGDFSLEVSSPGIDEPLKMLRQYYKNIGRNVEVVLNDGSKKEGKLLEVSETAIVLEQKEGKGKKAVTVNTSLQFADIKQTTVMISF